MRTEYITTQNNSHSSNDKNLRTVKRKHSPNVFVPSSWQRRRFNTLHSLLKNVLFNMNRNGKTVILAQFTKLFSPHRAMQMMCDLFFVFFFYFNENEFMDFISTILLVLVRDCNINSITICLYSSTTISGRFTHLI